MSRPRGRRELTLGEHCFWTVVTSVALCLTLAVALYIGA